MAGRTHFHRINQEKLKDDPEYIAALLMIDINAQLVARMKSKGVSQTELAKRIGKSQPYVNRILNHGTNMTLETLALFAAALDLGIEPPKFIPKECKRIPGTPAAIKKLTKKRIAQGA